MFNNILGNENVKETLEYSIKTGKLSHSYIFVGPSGIGKFLFAKEFAKAITCTSDSKPCNKCESCIKFNSNNNPDIKIIDEEEKTIKTEDIKEMVKSVYEKPIETQKKIYIINDCEKMTKEAQNSLLKTLEEPPQYVTIILITENENLLLSTIKSRCTKIKFNELTTNEVKEILKDKYGYKDISNNLLELANGSIQRALSLQGKEEIFNNTKEIFSNLENVDIIDLLSKKENIFKDKDNIQEILNYINVILYNKTKDDAKYINCINIVEDTKTRLKRNSNYDMTIDNLLLRMWEEVNG